MFWWLRYRSLLKYFEYSKDKDSKKQKILDKNELLVDAEISKLSNEKLLYYLFNNNINNVLRNKIIKRINNFTLEKRNELIEISKKRNYSLNMLEHYNDIGDKCIIIDELIKEKTYSEISKLLKRDEKDIIKLFNNNDIPFRYKKILINYYSKDQAVICKILNKVKDTKVIDYTIYGNKYSSTVIASILFTFNITDDIKEKILKYQIDENNVIDVLSSSLMASDDFRNVILKYKKEELLKNVMTIDIEDIKRLIRQDYCIDIVTLVYNSRYNDIVKLIKELRNTELLTFISNCNYELIVNLTYELRNKDISESINKTNKVYLMRIFSSKNITDEIKNQLLKDRYNDVVNIIEELNKYDILDIFNSEYVINELKDMIFDIDYDFLKNLVQDIDIYQIGKLYFSNSMYPKMKELILNLSINSKNIFTILNQNYMYENECKEIMDKHNFILRNYIKRMHPTDLIKFITCPEIPNHFIDYILNKNIDLVRNKMKDHKEECFNIAVDLKNVPFVIKKVLLDNTDIKDEEIDLVFTLGKYCKDSDLLNKYNQIKDFIENLGIEFELFIQYGIGSRKYKNWYKELSKILDNNDQDNFKKVSNYLFRYYYIDSEDNNINAIKDFLEILNNYYRYKELFTYIIDHNYILTTDDKTNLQFIFNEEIDIEIKDPNDIDKAKDELYKKYIRKINKDNISLEDIRSIYNDMLFGDALKEFERIGNKKGLLELRNRNNDSKVITNYIDELIKYIDFIELINDSTNIEGLIESLRLLFETNIHDFIKLKNEFSNIDKKIKRLYELDSQVNLTNISKIKLLNNDGYIDFSDKNYCLYAHVLSDNEKVDDIVNGNSNGERNFISLSPISYLGQRYYYGYDNRIIFAYDNIPDGSFIYSSRNNLGSNNLIKNNSSEVKQVNSYQEGILDTSNVEKNNAEALFYREGIKPCGLILVGNRKPTLREKQIHEEYGLPYIITQHQCERIDNVKEVFSKNTEYYDECKVSPLIKSMYDKISININSVNNDIYTGREIAILTDSHSMYEPTYEIFEDIRNRGINEIYSLGDNVGLGPNPIEVLDMLDYYKVKSVSGNSEYYNTLGTYPFSSYFDTVKLENQKWTEDILGSKRIDKMRLWTPSLDITVGDKRVGLCHFINDIRWDFNKQNTWSYQRDFKEGVNSHQFLYTNSREAIDDLKALSMSLKGKESLGVKDALKYPIFNGKRVTDYDTVIQGHVHFDMKDHIDNTSIYTLRAAGIGYRSDSKDTACYYILKERKDGNFDIERKLIRFDRHKLLLNVDSSTLPHKEYLLKMIK